EHVASYAAAIRTLDAQKLLYPSFESRAEIDRLVATCEAKGEWPRDPDGAPLYPGDAKNLPVGERARHIAAGSPFSLRLDMEVAMARAGALSWDESGSGPEQETGSIAAAPRAWGDV